MMLNGFKAAQVTPSIHPAVLRVTSRADKEPRLPGTSVRRSRIGFFDGEIIPLWCEQSQRHPGERKPIIPQQRLTLDNHMQPPRFSGDSAGIGTTFKKLTQKEGKMFKRDGTKEPHESWRENFNTRYSKEKL